MLDIGWSELLVIGVIALIVIGPRDLPHMFRSLGRITAKARGMAREFSNAMEDAARDSGLNEAASSLNDIKDLTKRSPGIHALDRAAERFEKWNPKVPSARSGARPDPAAKAPQETPDSTVGKPATGETAALAAASEAAPTIAAPAAEPAPAAVTTVPETGDGVTAKRQLHAVRRTPPKES